MSTAVPTRVKSVSRNGRMVHTLASREKVAMEEARRIQIGKRLKALRKDAALTQEQLAERAGVVLRTYQDWEYGESGTDVEQYEKLASVFGVSVQEIIGTETGVPAWASELKAQFDRMEREFAELRSMIAQLAVARSLAVDPPGRSEGQSEAEEERESSHPR